jgi:alkylation response protein AidB-like acyl-CoA dehydrogenase
MTARRPRDLLTDALLGQLGGTAERASGQPGVLAADIARLAEAGYLSVALPPQFGGLGCTLRQAACGQRRLARHAPRTALAVSAHLSWTGAAADAYRAGDNSARWILAEASRGALFAGGHGAAGGDLRFADPRSRCEPSADGGYEFLDRGALATITPAWDWLAVHGVHSAGGPARPQCVIAFAGRGTRCTPAFRVARAQPAGALADVFTTSALTWGHSILASVQYSDARRAFNAAITAVAEAATPADVARPGEPGSPNGPGSPIGRWPAAEAGTRLDAMKARIAEVTHPWQLVQVPAPDLGGQHLIGLHAMRHEVAEGAAHVHGLIAQITGDPAPASPLVP